MSRKLLVLCATALGRTEMHVTKLRREHENFTDVGEMYILRQTNLRQSVSLMRRMEDRGVQMSNKAWDKNKLLMGF